MRPSASTAGLAVSAVAVAAVVAARRRRAGVPNPQPETPAAPPPPLAGRLRTVATEDGVELHVEEFGPTCAVTGTLVLAHGYVQSSRLWAGQVRDVVAARSDVRVVVYDHRGHGRSGRTPRERATLEQLGRDLARVIEQVADGPVVVAGHSMGGMTIMALADQFPELFGTRVVGAAFVGTSSGALAEVTYGLPRPVARVVRAVLPVLNEKAYRDELAGKPRRQSPGQARLIFGRDAAADDIAVTLADMADCPAETVAFFLATFDQHDRRAALAALADLPAVVIVGDRDLLCPLEHSRAIVAALPRGELVVYPGAGHMVQLERREEVSRRLVDLLDRALPASAAAQPTDQERLVV